MIFQLAKITVINHHLPSPAANGHVVIAAQAVESGGTNHALRARHRGRLRRGTQGTPWADGSWAGTTLVTQNCG